MRKVGLIISFATLLILSSATIASDNGESIVEDLILEPQRSATPSYTSHGPIRIDNDTHFDGVALAEGWEGGGNATHPYIIEGYNITSSDTNIYIWSSRDFIIRDCYVQGDGGPFNPWGVYIVYAPNAHIENVTVFQ